jgi:hypothetical protein
MSAARHTAPVPRTALTREEAAQSLGMSLDSFERYVQPTIRLVRAGRMRLVPIRELDRWRSRTTPRGPSTRRHDSVNMC